ncbi:MAG: DUF4249 family protein [Dysgonomonas sp.]
MKKVTNKYIYFLSFSLLLISCGKELTQYDASIKTPIVESYLKAEDSKLTVKVYSMESFNEEVTQYSKGISNLQIYVNDQLLTESATAGTYTLENTSGILNIGSKCDLRFDYNNQSITATTNIPSKPQDLAMSRYVIEKSSWNFGDTIPEVILSWNNTDNSYYQVYIQSLSESSGSTQAPSFMGGGFGKMLMQPIQGSSYTLGMQDMSFEGNYRCILYKVTKEYAELYERMSSTDLANPVSFVENGFGIFTAFNSDTIIYKVVYTD